MGTKGTFDRFAIKVIPVVAYEALDCTDCNGPMEISMRLDAFELESGNFKVDRLFVNERMYKYVKQERFRRGRMDVRIRGILCEVPDA